MNRREAALILEVPYVDVQQAVTMERLTIRTEKEASPKNSFARSTDNSCF